MIKITCSFCGDDKYTASPQLFVGDIHKGCGGHYQYAEGNKGCQGVCIYKAPMSLKDKNPSVIWCAKNGSYMIFDSIPCSDCKDREKRR